MRAIKPFHAIPVILMVGHQEDEAHVYIAITTAGDTSSMFNALLVQLIFKNMVQDKVLATPEALHPSYTAPLTNSLLIYTNRFCGSVQKYAKDLHLNFLPNNVCHEIAQKIFNTGLQKFALRTDF